MPAKSKETHSFETEVQQLLHLMIHSLYTNKEIFLRELISNASDACDRLRFEALTNDALVEDEEELSVQVSVNEKAKTVTIYDNGIGMSKEEVIENIGTIARSGTRKFLDSLTNKESADAHLIGQFGVGFYSVFLVADKVELSSRRAGDPKKNGVRWISDGNGEYTIEPIELRARGTEIKLHLKKDAAEFSEDFRVRNIIERYSDHISFPIKMLEKDSEREDKKESKKVNEEWVRVNKGSPIWARPRNEITEDEYNQFYSTLSYDTEPPLVTLHNRVEGTFEYSTLFFVPSKAPFDLWDREQRHGINLYVRRIFILDDAKHLIPNYLRFIRGVVDANDLPLNVSREFLQSNRDIDRIRSASVKKVLTEFTRISNKESQKYKDLWNEYGKVIKEGMIEDHENRDVLAKLLRFSTTKSEQGTQDVPLDDYVKRMAMKQKDIYFITAESENAARTSPHLEIFQKNDIEVLLLSDPVDEWLVTSLTEFDGKSLKSVAKGGLNLDDFTSEEDKKTAKKKEEGLSSLLTKMQELLGERVKEVKVSHRLTDSPACLVADEQDIGANLERILQSMGQQAPNYKPILEINPDHPLIRQLSPDHQRLEDWALVLFDQAALSEGAFLQEPAAYVTRVNELLAQVSLLGG
jgi:molecular chaperone HtpG